MNQEDILKMASDSGFGSYAYEAASMFERFAALVAAKAAQDEREACASVAEAERWNDVYPEEKVIHDEACQEIAAVIRTRGQ